MKRFHDILGPKEIFLGKLGKDKKIKNPHTYVICVRLFNYYHYIITLENSFFIERDYHFIFMRFFILKHKVFIKKT